MNEPLQMYTLACSCLKLLFRDVNCALPHLPPLPPIRSIRSWWSYNDPVCLPQYTIPAYLVAYATQAPFFIALVGITYAILSASWDEEVRFFVVCYVSSMISFRMVTL